MFLLKWFHNYKKPFNSLLVVSLAKDYSWPWETMKLPIKTVMFFYTSQLDCW
jgi:hypothetical protein